MSQPKTTLLRIPLANIRENPVALRSVNRQSEDYACFAGSVKSRGVLNPILVREITTPDGEAQLYGLIEGLHRYTASLDAGFKDIPAQVMNMDDANVMEAQLIGNAQRIDTKPVEYSKHLQLILTSNPMMTMTVLAGKLNKTTTWLSERLGLLKLAKKIGELVDAGKINVSNAYALAKLPEDEQDAFVDRAMTTTPQEFLQTVLGRKKELDKAKREGRDARPAEFVPVPHMQKLSEVKDEMGEQKIGTLLCAKHGAKTAEEGFALAVRWFLHMDPDSIEAAKVKDDERKKKVAAEKAAAAVERANKRAQEAAQEAAKLTQEPVAV